MPDFIELADALDSKFNNGYESTRYWVMAKNLFESDYSVKWGKDIPTQFDAKHYRKWGNSERNWKQYRKNQYKN